MTVCFDVDGCLINLDNTPNYPVIETLKFFASCVGVTVVVWSGGGKDWAENWVQKLGLEKYVDVATSKSGFTEKPDIAFDDEFVDLATVNVKIRTYEHKN